MSLNSTVIGSMRGFSVPTCGFSREPDSIGLTSTATSRPRCPNFGSSLHISMANFARFDLTGRRASLTFRAASDRKLSSNVAYLALDLLFMESSDLRALPLRERKARLSKMLAKLPPRIQYVDHIAGDGPRFHALACQQHAEGIVCKRLDVPYQSGDRGLWRKVRCVNEEEFVIVGFKQTAR
jgi:hypothetical protein